MKIITTCPGCLYDIDNAPDRTSQICPYCDLEFDRDPPMESSTAGVPYDHEGMEMKVLVGAAVVVVGGVLAIAVALFGLAIYVKNAL